MTFPPGQTVYHHSRSYVNRVQVVEKVEGCLNLYRVQDAAKDMLAIEYHVQAKDLYFTELAARHASLQWLDERHAAVSAYIAKHSETL